MPFQESARERVAAWLRANDIDPKAVPEDNPITVSTKADGTRVVSYTELQRSDTGHILADPQGGPVTELRETPLITTSTPDTEPWTVDHDVTLFAQNRTRPGPTDDTGDRWAEYEYTGLMLAVCNCGMNTGWINRDKMPSHETLADGEQHAELIGRANRTG